MNYETAIAKFDIKDTPRQKRKWKNKRGLAYKLSQKVTEDYKPSGTEEIKYLTDCLSKPGPKDEKEEKVSKSNRQSRKVNRNDNRRKENERQKNAKKNRWRNRKES